MAHHANRWATVAGGLLVLLLAVPVAAHAVEGEAEDAEPRQQRYEFSEPHMGVPFRLVLYSADAQAANRAAGAAFARIAQLDRVLSDYQSDSELMRLSDTAGSGQDVPVSGDLWAVLQRSRELSTRSGGAFDITVGPVVRLWRRARRNREFPSADRLAEALAATGYEKLELTLSNRSARLTAPGMRLDAGGIGMGYAADAALAVLKQHGISQALVDASGDVAAGDAPPGTAGWRIGFGYEDAASETPTHYALLCNTALTTSGDMYQFVEFDGRRYSHIVDPRTGLGLTDQSTVTIIAADCTTADSLATAVSVLGPQLGLALVEQTPTAAALIQRNVDGRIERQSSSRLPQYLAPP